MKTNNAAEIPRVSSFRDIDSHAKLQFKKHGLIVIDNAIGKQLAQQLAARFEPLFRGEFDSGIYPDEWYWREGISYPNAVRHMSNAWKSDQTIAKFVLSDTHAKIAAELTAWSGVRVGQDTLCWKVPGSSEGAYQQDSSFIDFLDPPMMVTLWVALDETECGSGTIEYVPGSHRWPISRRPADFHSPKDGYQAEMRSAAAAAGISTPECIEIEVPQGGAVFHHGSIWHGSGPNRSKRRIRRSISIHFIHQSARFATESGGYIYGRYKLLGNAILDEAFFPITWSSTGYRSLVARNASTFTKAQEKAAIGSGEARAKLYETEWHSLPARDRRRSCA